MALPNEYRDWPTASTTAFGRIWYGMSNRVMFSQIFIDNKSVLGLCLQKNDPTSSENPDILATDGGEVQIQDAGDIIALQEFLKGVLVFAENGVWYVYGQTEGFSALDYAVEKITSYPLISPRGVIVVGSMLMYASGDGIHMLRNNEFGELNATLMSEQKVDDYITDRINSSTYAEYSPREKQITWVFPGQGWVVYDTRLDSWFPQSLPQRDLNCSFQVDLDQYFVCTSNAVGTPFTVSDISDTSYTDFGTSYRSFLETSHETGGDFTKKKSIPLLNVFFKRTETEITGVDGVGNYEYDNPSDCLYGVFWDWNTSTQNYKFRPLRSAYRPLPRGFIPNSIPYSLDNIDPVVNSRQKIRGHGRSFRVLFEAVPGKDMQILGYSVEMNTRSRQ